RRRMHMAAKISLLLLVQNAPYRDSIPGTLVRFEMMPVPGDRPFWIGKTEVTWDEYDIWAFRLDLTPRERSSGVDATARPSRPDMLGNVAEWVTGTDSGGRPVVRGGSWNDPPDHVSPTARARQTPAWNETDPQFPKSRWWLADAPFVGFRIVREP